ncbi:MAG TPA: ATP-dependent DNA helicase RecG [Spirochaetia bacterium]|nr:ATP-dependent DNA helicase RecG [Spirochaetia bacterium]
MFLRELKTSLDALPGVGPRTAELLANLDVHTIADLLLHVPRDYEDRRLPVSLEQAALQGRPANTLVRVVAHHYIGRGKRRTLKVQIEEVSTAAAARDLVDGASPDERREAAPADGDEVSGGGPRAALMCFGRSFLSRTLAVGKLFWLYGGFAYRYGELQSSSFEIEPFDPRRTRSLDIRAIYPLTTGLTQGAVRRAVRHALDEYAVHVEDELPAAVAERHGIPPKAALIREIHLATSPETAERARRAMAFEELFYLQIAVGRRSLRRKSEHRPPRRADSTLQGALRRRLPFSLTPDQEQVVSEIDGDLFSPQPMARLLQGEVGSGKTLVAVLAALTVIGAREQAALMAPTELLARQHADTIARLLGPLGVRLALLTGNVKDPHRGELLRALREGDLDLVIGTHALFTHPVRFARLGLVIVDEQHRFGVLQRLALTQKGRDPDLLLMTATPIPRTLALTAFGDLDISTITHMPPGRRPTETHLVRMGNEPKVYEFVRAQVAAGRQAYFVYPLIEQSEALDLKDAESMFVELSTAVFPNMRLSLMHSRVPEDERNDSMERFVRGEVDLLIATSVVEVGVDVPNATVIVIHHAERFGLAALHQLRGRVGRGEHSSYAFLVYDERLSDAGKQRLKIMKESTDGFRIAEEDLKLRGPGDVAGTRQSGIARLTIADLLQDFDLLKEAREEAFALLERDAGLLDAENRVIREVLERALPFEEEMFKGG